MDNKKDLLIYALEEERKHFLERGFDTTGHDIALDYLKTGTTDKDPERYELLDACMNDFETMCLDYGV